MERILARPTVANVEMTLADTEYSYALPAGTARFSFKLRNPGYQARIAFVSGALGTTYKNLMQGEIYSEKNLRQGPNSLYFQSPTAGQVAEILTWVA